MPLPLCMCERVNESVLVQSVCVLFFHRFGNFEAFWKQTHRTFPWRSLSAKHRSYLSTSACETAWNPSLRRAFSVLCHPLRLHTDAAYHNPFIKKWQNAIEAQCDWDECTIAHCQQNQFLSPTKYHVYRDMHHEFRGSIKLCCEANLFVHYKFEFDSLALWHWLSGTAWEKNTFLKCNSKWTYVEAVK